MGKKMKNHLFLATIVIVKLLVPLSLINFLLIKQETYKHQKVIIFISSFTSEVLMENIYFLRSGLKNLR